MRSIGFLTVLSNLVFMGTLATIANAGTFNIAKKVALVDSAADDQFGRSVAIDGRSAIVGAWQFKYYEGMDAGYASVLDVATRHELVRLAASDGAANDAFGIAVGLSGNTAVVGASLDDDYGDSSGSAYLFDTTNGKQLYKLAASDATAEDQFGWATAISGPSVLVSAPYNDESGTDAGAAYLFDASTGSQLHKLTAKDATPGDLFGRSVAIDGNLAIVGAQAKDIRTGAAYLFDAVTGAELFRLLPLTIRSEANFGASVSISGNRAIVGAPGEDSEQADTGTAYVFDTTTGAELYRLTASDARGYSYFGGSVSICGDLAVVGAWGDTYKLGAAYVFDLTTGQELMKLTAPDRELNDRFGEYVGIDGGTIVASVRLDDDYGNASGAAYFFTPEPSTFLLLVFAISLSGYQRRRRTK